MTSEQKKICRTADDSKAVYVWWHGDPQGERISIEVFPDGEALVTYTDGKDKIRVVELGDWKELYERLKPS